MRTASVLFSALAFTSLLGQWSSVGGGIPNGQSFELLYVPDSASLMLVGNVRYMVQDDLQVNGVAYYKNGSWHKMRSGVTHPQAGLVPEVRAVCAYDGALLVAGSFFRMDSVPNTSFVARWQEGAWHSMGIDSSAQEVGLIMNLSVLENHAHLLGWFDWDIDGTMIHSWAVWDGVQWAPGDTNGLFPFGYTGQINQVCDFQSQRYVGGNFSQWNVPNDLAVLNNGSWQEVGPGIQGDAWVNEMVVYDERLWIGGEFYAGAGNPATGLMTWDGVQWSDPFPQITFTSAVLDVMVADNKLYFAGPFIADGLPGDYRFGVFDGEQLCVIGGNQILVAGNLAVSPDTLYSFVYHATEELDRIAQWPLDAPADTCYSVVQGVHSEQSTLWAIAVWPNPSNDLVTFRFASLSARLQRLVVHDELGRTVLQVAIQPGQRELRVGLSGVTVGTYRASFLDKDGALVGGSSFVVLR